MIAVGDPVLHLKTLREGVVTDRTASGGMMKVRWNVTGEKRRLRFRWFSKPIEFDAWLDADKLEIMLNQIPQIHSNELGELWELADSYGKPSLERDYQSRSSKGEPHTYSAELYFPENELTEKVAVKKCESPEAALSQLLEKHEALRVL